MPQSRKRCQSFLGNKGDVRFGSRDPRFPIISSFMKSEGTNFARLCIIISGNWWYIYIGIYVYIYIYIDIYIYIYIYIHIYIYIYIPRQTLFKSQNDTNTNLLLASRKSSRIPFVTTWHHKLSGFQSILRLRYREMIEQFPNLKCIFPEAPILSFRRNKNLRNQLVHTSLTIGTQKTSEQSGYSTPCLSKRGKGCKLCSFMSNTNVITNKLSHKSCYTSGGKCFTTDTIYAAECTRHRMIYVGQSSQKLNSRFNGHRSDVKVKLKACELSQHFPTTKNAALTGTYKFTYCRIT